MCQRDIFAAADRRALEFIMPISIYFFHLHISLGKRRWKDRLHSAVRPARTPYRVRSWANN